MKKSNAFVKRLMAATMAAALCATMTELPVAAQAGQNEKGIESNAGNDAADGTVSDADTESKDAFDIQNISGLYNEQKIILSNPEQVKAAYSKAAEGLLVSGNSTDVADNTFTFADEFDFSGGTIGRVDVDALSVKGTKAKLEFYLDDNTTPFAEVKPAEQKRAKKWYTKIETTSVSEQKITGKHKVSFKIVPGENETTTGMALRAITFTKSTVPTIYFNIDETKGSIDSMNGDQQHDTECYGDMKVEIPNGYTCEYANDKGKTNNLKTETYSMEYIRGRGNSTWGTGKNPYKIKLDKKANLFNMGKNKHWVLLADYYDPSHIRNKITYWMGKKLGMAYTPECVYVDVVMNGQYYGSYLLSEQVRVGNSRVDIDDLEADDESKAATDEPTITGGYLLSMSPYKDEDGKIIHTKQGTDYLIERPSFEDYENEAQYNYISKYVQDTEDAIYGKDFKKDGKSYAEYMDVAAAIDYYWMQEFSMNGDAFGSTSTYLYKPRNGKLFWGPLWDFDYVAWGNNEYNEYNCEGWAMKENVWFGRLFRDKDFADKMIARWTEIRKVMEEASKDGGQIDQYAEKIRNSMKYNAYQYGDNYDVDEKDKTFQQSVDQLKGWIQARIKWVNENINTLQTKYHQVKFMDGKKVLSIQNVADGDSAEFPKTGTKKGYVFSGWYANDDGETYRVDKKMEIYNDMTITAKWTRADRIKPVSKIILGYDKITQTYQQTDSDHTDDDEADTFSIPYYVIGGNGENEELVWKCSNSKVGKISGDGEIQILGVGDTVVTASTKNGKVKASCKVHIIEPVDDEIYCNGFDLNKTDVKMKKGGYTVLNAIPYPDDITESFDVEYYCDDPAVELETFGNKCIVKGVRDGEAQITVVSTIQESGTVIRVCKVKVGTATQKQVKPGMKVVSGGIAYKVSSVTVKGGTVKAIGISNAKKTSLKIPSAIKIAKKKYTVTAVASKAFKSNKKLKSVVFGANVKRVGDKAFYGCKNLKTVQFKAGKAKFGKQAFAKTDSKMKLKAKKADQKTYQKRLKKAGAKNVTVVK